MYYIFKRKLVLCYLLLVALLIVAGCSSSNSGTESETPGQSQNEDKSVSSDSEKSEMETSIVLGTNPTGSAYNSVGTGVATVISDHAPFQVSVSTYAGPNIWLPLMNNNEVHLGVAASPDIFWAYNGEEPYQSNKNIRTIVRGNWTDAAGFVVREDSEIQSVNDLKGKRLASDYGAHQIIMNILTTQLEGAGLTWDDVTPVPVTSYPQGLEALRDNQVDAAFGGSPTTSAGMEIDAAVGIRPLNYGDVAPEELDNFPEELMQKLQERVPGSRVVSKQAGWAQEEFTLIEYPLFLAASSSLSEEAAYEVTKILWENYQELHPIFPWLEQWTAENMFDPRPPAPYHDGAVKYFKEIGVWTDEAEQYHQELLGS